MLSLGFQTLNEGLLMFRMFTYTFLAIQICLHAQIVIDLTHTLSEETLVYPGKSPFSRVICANYENGYRLDDMSLNTGIGTHMDAFNHFCFEGGMDTISLSDCFGPACIIHLEHKVQDNIDYGITSQDIEEWEALHGKIPEGSIVLFHTGWDKHFGTTRFCEPDAQGVCHFPGITKEAALLLVSRKACAIGIDAMGIDVGIDHSFIAHKILLGARIPLVENLARLKELPPTGSTIYMLPMKIKDAPEAPVRAMAIIE